MENTKNWYVVYTKPKQEERVADLLKRRQIESYIPKHKQTYNWHGREKKMKTIVFPSMLFVLANEQDQPKIKQVDGITGILFWLQKPAVIQSGEILELKQFLNTHHDVIVEKAKVMLGLTPFSTSVFDGNRVIRISGDFERLALPSIGYSLGAKLDVEEEFQIVA